MSLQTFFLVLNKVSLDILDLNLFQMVYTRPSSITFPMVWHRFIARGTKLRVQDLTEEQVEPAIQLLVKYFTADEPPCKYIGMI